MFGGKDKRDKGQQKTTNIASNTTTIIASGTKVVGDLNFSGNLNLEGEVEGSIKALDANCKVRVSLNGKVKGDIQAPIVMINGCVEGNVYSTSFLELSSNADIHGDLHYKELETEKGSRINGRLIFEPQESSAPKKKPILVESAAPSSKKKISAS